MKNSMNYIKAIYTAFIGDNLTIKQFNTITDVVIRLQPFNSFYFRELTTQYIYELKETYPDDFTNDILFDVVEFEPSDYKLSIYFYFNPDTEIITIKSVSIES